MTDLLAELRRSTRPGDDRVADLLTVLRAGEGATPRANEQLATFLSARVGGVTARPAHDLDPAEPELVVVLGPARVTRRPRRFGAALAGGIWVKVALGAAAAVAATALAAGEGPARDVVVRPAASPTPSAPASPPAGPDDGEPTPRARHLAPVGPTVPRDSERASAHSVRPGSTAPPAAEAGPKAGHDEQRAGQRPGGGRDDTGARSGGSGGTGAEADDGDEGDQGGEGEGDEGGEPDGDEADGDEVDGSGSSGSGSSGSGSSGSGSDERSGSADSDGGD